MTGPIISIVAGGWSMESIDHAKIPGTIIAVNDSAFYLERLPSYIVSMDRLWSENRWSDDPKARGGLKGLCLPTYLRRGAAKRIAERPDWLHIYDCKIDEPLMSLDAAVLNGPNSGHGAMNLAFTLRPATLFLFGFDMCRNADNKAYWFPPYPWTGKPQGATSRGRYSEWAAFMRSAAEQFSDLGCRVFNVSPMSAIQCFEKVSARELGVHKQ